MAYAPLKIVLSLFHGLQQAFLITSRTSLLQLLGKLLTHLHPRLNFKVELFCMILYGLYVLREQFESSKFLLTAVKAGKGQISVAAT